MLPLQNDGSGRGKARLRKIVARATRTFGFLAYGGLDVACRVPPFGLKFGMGEKVAGKFIAITRQGKAIRRVQRRKDRQEQRRAEGSTPHARPQRGSIAQRFARGRIRRGRWRRRS